MSEETIEQKNERLQGELDTLVEVQVERLKRERHAALKRVAKLVGYMAVVYVALWLCTRWGAPG